MLGIPKERCVVGQRRWGMGWWWGSGGSETQPGSSSMRTRGSPAGPLLAKRALWWTLCMFKVSDRTWSSANWRLHFPKSVAARDNTEKNHRPPNGHPTPSFDASSLYQVFPATEGGPGGSVFLRVGVSSREVGPTGGARLPGMWGLALHLSGECGGWNARSANGAREAGGQGGRPAFQGAPQTSVNPR